VCAPLRIGIQAQASDEMLFKELLSPLGISFRSPDQAEIVIAYDRADAPMDRSLQIALIALGVKSEDFVVTPSVSFNPTAKSVVHVGVNPIFAGIDWVTYDLEIARGDLSI